MIAAGAWTLWIVFSHTRRLDSQMLTIIHKFQSEDDLRRSRVLWQSTRDHQSNQVQ